MTDLTPDSTPAEVQAAWVKALRSGEFEQGTARLASEDVTNGRARYCCLGVLCELAYRAGVVETRSTPNHGREGTAFLRFIEYDGAVTYPNRRVYEWAGVDAGYGGEGKVRPTALPTGLAGASLAVLNDDEGWSFEQIADLIERGGLVPLDADS